jgi:hypothetical protein
MNAPAEPIAFHSKIGASSMYRWAACPGSVRESAGIESESSEYAKEGTAAHALAEACLTGEYNAQFFVGQEFTYDDHGNAESIVVTQEMADHIQVYLDHVREVADHKDAVLLVEHKFHLKELNEHLFGTADAVIWRPDNQTLYVYDLKFGAGLPVEVNNNSQLKYYALGALLGLKFPAKHVEFGIIQPRCFHADGPVRTKVMHAADLIDFAADLVDAVAATEDPNAPLHAGDWCKFCPASFKCKELVRRKNEAMKLEFAADKPYDPEELAAALEAVPLVKAWLSAIDSFAYKEAEAGRCPPRFKLVEKRATRKWNTDDKPTLLKALSVSGVGLVNFVEEKMKSPAQVEKLLPKEHRELLAALTVKESSGHTLVPADDKREALKVSAKDDFANAPLND